MKEKLNTRYAVIFLASVVFFTLALKFHTAINLLISIAVTASVLWAYEKEKTDFREKIDKINQRFSPIISCASTTLGNLKLTTEKVSKFSAQTANGSSEQASSIEDTAATLEQISAGIRMNAENSEHARSEVQAVMAQAFECSNAMEELLKVSIEIQEYSEKMAQIISNINDISDQTNLLALNAAIEAARAGEAGRGFAVVAEEVRKLANNSAAAAHDTNLLIKENQKNAEKCITASNDVKEVINRMSESVSSVNQTVVQVSQASSEQAAAIEVVNNSVTLITNVVVDNVTAANEVDTGSRELSNEAVELEGSIKQITTIFEEFKSSI